MLVHKHLIIRAECTNPPVKGDEGRLRQWIYDLIDKIDMKLLSGPHIKYVDVKGNMGYTSVSIIETSHIAIHVWEEQDPALIQLDVYTCGPINAHDAFDHLEEFKPVKVQYKFFDREFDIEEEMVRQWVTVDAGK